MSSTGMRMLSGSLASVDEGSPSATTAAPLLTSRWSQTQMTPKGATTTGFDAHRALTLAALFGVLVAVLGLYSLLRCALNHCVRRRRRAQLAALNKSVLRMMPVAVYEAAAEGGAPAGAECAICLGEFEDGDAVRLLPRCRHGFHVRCIDTWLSAHSSCPICRDSLLDEGAGASAAAAGEDTTAWSSFIAGMLYLA